MTYNCATQPRPAERRSDGDDAKSTTAGFKKN